MRVLYLLLLLWGCDPVRRVQSVPQQQRLAVSINATYLRSGDVHEQTLWQGSGVIIGERDVLTAAHVVAYREGWVLQRVTIESALWVPHVRTAQIVGVDRVHDAAHLVVSEAYAGAPRVLVGRARRGTKACAVVSRPLKGRPCGRVSETGYRPASPDVKVDLGLSWAPVPGNSGAPLFDSQGRLVGLITHRQACGTGLWCSGLATSLISLGLLRSP